MLRSWLLADLGSFDVGLVGLHGRGFTAQLELGPWRVVLDVVADVPGAGERLAVVEALTTGAGECEDGQSQSTGGVAQPDGRVGLHGSSSCGRWNSVCLLAALESALALQSMQSSRSLSTRGPKNFGR